MVDTVWGLSIIPCYFLQNRRVAVDLSLASGVWRLVCMENGKHARISQVTPRDVFGKLTK